VQIPSVLTMNGWWRDIDTLTHESIDTRNLEAKSISAGAQYVTSDSEIYCGKVKMCKFSSGNWFFSTKFVQLAVAGKWHNAIVHLQNRVINWTWLRLSISDWSIIMIGPGGLLFLHICSSSFIGGVAKKTAKLRHLILLSRVTYWALMEML